MGSVGRLQGEDEFPLHKIELDRLLHEPGIELSNRSVWSISIEPQRAGVSQSQGLHESMEDGSRWNDWPYDEAVMKPATTNEPGESFAQYGEDRLLAEMFAHRRHGTYVEIGAHDGIALSNTYYFERLGWNGLLVEALPHVADACRRNRPGSAVVQRAIVRPTDVGTVTIDWVEEAEMLSGRPVERGVDPARRAASDITPVGRTRVEVPASTLDQVLRETSIKTIDFMTVDVEGAEWGVLQGFTIERWRPRYVLLERNDPRFDPRIVHYMSSHGYVLERRTGVNDWYRYCGQPSVGLRHRMRFRVRWQLTTFLRRQKRRLRALARRALGPRSAARVSREG